MAIQGPSPQSTPLITYSPRPRVANSPSPAAPAAPAPGEGSLWDMLTEEERAFFSEQAALGSVTYRPGRSAQPAPAAPLGQRLDVRG